MLKETCNNNYISLKSVVFIHTIGMKNGTGKGRGCLCAMSVLYHCAHDDAHWCKQRDNI